MDSLQLNKMVSRDSWISVMLKTKRMMMMRVNSAQEISENSQAMRLNRHHPHQH